MKTEVLTKSAHLHPKPVSEKPKPVSEKDKESLTTGKATVTVLLAFLFLAVVIGLSYLFIAGAQ